MLLDKTEQPDSYRSVTALWIVYLACFNINTSLIARIFWGYLIMHLNLCQYLVSVHNISKIFENIRNSIKLWVM